MTEEPDELLDLFDGNERLLGVVSRLEYYKDKAKYPGYLRSAELFIINDMGQLWVPRRSARRLVAPGGLDYSCGGHVAAGETYVQGCIREAWEELNISLHESDLEHVHTTTPQNDGAPWFRQLFVYRSNDAPDYNREDFSEYYWLTPDELIARLDAGEPSKASLPTTIRAIRTLLHT